MRRIDDLPQQRYNAGLNSAESQLPLSKSSV